MVDCIQALSPLFILLAPLFQFFDFLLLRLALRVRLFQLCRHTTVEIPSTAYDVLSTKLLQLDFKQIIVPQYDFRSGGKTV